MEPKTIAEAHKIKKLRISKQLDIDIALSVMKLTPDQIERLIDADSRHFDVVKDNTASLQAMACDGLNVEFEFEDYNGFLYHFNVEDLSIDDKIYLLEEIEKL